MLIVLYAYIVSLYYCVCLQRRGLLLANRIAARGKCHCRRRQKGRSGVADGYGARNPRSAYTRYIYTSKEREAPPGVSSYAKRIYAFIIRFIMRICPENVYNIYAARINRLFLGTIPSPSVSHTLSGGLFFVPFSRRSH
jgi:hypothetical protein